MPNLPKVNLKRVLGALGSNSSQQSSSGVGASRNSKNEPGFGEHLTGAQFQPCKVCILLYCRYIVIFNFTEQ